MLSKKEKREMLKDGRDLKRRDDFAIGRIQHKSPPSLDEYIQFLKSAQKVFPSSANSKRKAITDFNRI